MQTLTLILSTPQTDIPHPGPEQCLLLWPALLGPRGALADNDGGDSQWQNSASRDLFLWSPRLVLAALGDRLGHCSKHRQEHHSECTARGLRPIG